MVLKCILKGGISHSGDSQQLHYEFAACPCTWELFFELLHEVIDIGYSALKGRKSTDTRENEIAF